MLRGAGEGRGEPQHPVNNRVDGPQTSGHTGNAFLCRFSFPESSGTGPAVFFVAWSKVKAAEQRVVKTMSQTLVKLFGACVHLAGFVSVHLIALLSRNQPHGVAQVAPRSLRSFAPPTNL